MLVAEVLLGLLKADPRSYLNLSAVSMWIPSLPSAHEGDFTVADLLRFAGAV